MTKTIKAFSEKLKSSIEIAVIEQDETLSTFEAQERMKSDPRFNFQVDYSKIDSMSALITLEEYLNSKDN
jgi:RNase H-fold protein (predicted Holliday junction resolvase)